MIDACVWEVSLDYTHLCSTFNDAPSRSGSNVTTKRPWSGFWSCLDQGWRWNEDRLELHLRSLSLVLINGSSPALVCWNIIKWPEKMSQRTLNKSFLDSNPRKNEYLTIVNVWLKVSRFCSFKIFQVNFLKQWHFILLKQGQPES